MPRIRWVAPLLLIPLLVPSPAAAQAATISVDDDTPNVGQTVDVTTTCPGPGTFQFVSVTIFTTPAIPNAADPPFFFSAVATSTFSLTFNVADDFTIRASCTYVEGTAANSTLVLAVTTPPTDTGAPPTDTGAPPTDTGAPPTDARRRLERCHRRVQRMSRLIRGNCRRRVRRTRRCLSRSSSWGSVRSYSS